MWCYLCSSFFICLCLYHFNSRLGHIFNSFLCSWCLILYCYLSCWINSIKCLCLCFLFFLLLVLLRLDQPHMEQHINLQLQVQLLLVRILTLMLALLPFLSSLQPLPLWLNLRLLLLAYGHGLCGVYDSPTVNDRPVRAYGWAAFDGPRPTICLCRSIRSASGMVATETPYSANGGDAS